MTNDRCPYSKYSLQFFLLPPLVILGSLIESLPIIVVLALSAIVPIVLYEVFFQLSAKLNYVNLVKHRPRPDHPHSSLTTLGVILISTILGLAVALGLTICIRQPKYSLLGCYLIILTTFHFSEYFVMSLTNPSTLNLESFLLNQPLLYYVTTLASLIEFFTEFYIFPEIKVLNPVAIIGFALCILGESIRKLAMLTAGKNFTHLIALEKESGRRLVTNGVYSVFRHPSYAGWFYWAIGTQVLLCNPICTVLFAAMSFAFFKDRIRYEEGILLEFFGKDYEDYRERVGLWMPVW